MLNISCDPPFNHTQNLQIFQTFIPQKSQIYTIFGRFELHDMQKSTSLSFKSTTLTATQSKTNLLEYYYYFLQ